RADDDRLRLHHHVVVAGVRNGAAGHHRGHAAAGAATQAAVHGVAVQVAAAVATARGVAVGEHAHDFVEVLAGEFAVWPGAAHGVVQRALVPFACSDLG